ncbi:MAG: hypothetical protein ACJ0H0_05870 [Vicinamibacterales bacterium]
MRSDYRRGRSGIREASVDGLGLFFPLLVLFVVVPWFGRHTIFLGQPFLIPLLLLGLSAFGGGLLTGQLLAVSIRCRFALAVAHGLGVWPIAGIVATLPALVGHESVGALAIRFVPAFSVGYFLIGGLVVLLAGHGWKQVMRSAGVGLVSGAAGAAVLIITMFFVSSETSAAVQWFLAVFGSIVACLLSSGMIGRWAFRAL